MDRAEIEALMDRYRQPAIMVYRPFPPGRIPYANSHLGGRPALPPGVAWPRRKDGMPLHFLAMIDCAELPQTDGVLPDEGVLFFFANMVEDMDWGYGDPHDDCRVIFAECAGLEPIAPPADIPCIMSGHTDLQRHFVLPDEPPASTYPHWPVVCRPISSWPDSSALPNVSWSGSPDQRCDDHSSYQEAVDRARADEALRAAELPVPTGPGPHWHKNIYESRGPVDPPEDAEAPFPQIWIMIDRMARRLGNWARETLVGEERRRPGGRSNFDTRQLQGIVDTAETWVRLAASSGLDTVPDEEAGRRFKAWLAEVQQDNRMHIEGVLRAINDGMGGAVRYAVTSARAAELFPARYLKELERGHLPARFYRGGPEGQRLRRHHHQLLGHAGSSQDRTTIDPNKVMLLQLFSDYGLSFMFCDCGEAEFWIDRDDLAARRFEKVTAHTCGG